MIDFLHRNRGSTSGLVDGPIDLGSNYPENGSQNDLNGLANDY